MRDARFVAEHRGWPLKKEQHQQLIRWACDCVRHVLLFLSEDVDERLKHALKVAWEWEAGNASVGDARNAAFGAIAVANESENPTKIAIARAVGHAVATAHMADHASGWAEYALKAIIFEWGSIDEERRWQNEQLPPEIKELVLSSREMKSKSWNTSFEKAQKIKRKQVTKRK